MTQLPQPPERVEPASPFQVCSDCPSSRMCGSASRCMASQVKKFERPTEPGAPAPAHGDDLNTRERLREQIGRVKKALLREDSQRAETLFRAASGLCIAAGEALRDGIDNLTEAPRTQPKHEPGSLLRKAQRVEGKAEAAPADEPQTCRHGQVAWCEQCDDKQRIARLGRLLEEARREAEQHRLAFEAQAERANRWSLLAQEEEIAKQKAEVEAEQLRRERDEALGMLDAMQARVCELEPRWRELEQERDAAIDDTKDYMDMAQQLEAARAALAERERAAFEAGYESGAADELHDRSADRHLIQGPSRRYAAWQATQPATPSEREP